jgi:hypothetical protein
MNINGVANIIGGVVSAVNQQNMLNMAARNEFEFKHVLCPILLKNGLAEKLPDKLMPIVQLTQQQGYPLTPAGYFAHFKVVQGSTFMQSTVASYPFANSATAGNAIVEQPINVSLLMYCPASAINRTESRAQTMTNLISSLNSHKAQGGLFVVYTPLFIYDNCVLVAMRDASEGEHSAMQNGVILDFQRPMIMTMDEADTAQNTLMSKLSKGEKV